MHIGYLGCVEIAYVDRFQLEAVSEHATHVGYLGGVKVAHINACQIFAITEHPCHIGHFTGVQVVQSLDGSEIVHIIKPFVCRQRAGTGERGGKSHTGNLVTNGAVSPCGKLIALNQVEDLARARAGVTVVEETQRRVGRCEAGIGVGSFGAKGAHYGRH